MSGAATGFFTGLLGGMAENIGERKDEARDYFNQQMELARTRGMENKAKIAEAKKGGLLIANQLKQIGVPEDLIVSIAKQNPDDLPQVFDQIQDLKARGVNADEQFFRDFLEVSGEAAGEGETIDQVFQRIYEPLANTDPGVINDDPKGTIWSAMMGFDAMENARRKLSETEVIDGMSAEQLLRYPDKPQVRDSGTTVTMNAELAGEKVRDLEGDDISDADAARAYEMYNEEYNGLYNDWTDSEGNHPKDSKEFTPEIDEELKREAFETTASVFGVDTMQGIPYFQNLFAEDTEAVSDTAMAKTTSSKAKIGAVWKGWTLVSDNSENNTSVWVKGNKTKTVYNEDAPAEFNLSTGDD